MTVSKSTAALLLALAAGACGGRDAPATISRQRFVAANVALRAVPDSLPAADSLRAAALRRSGVTAPQLRAWIRTNTGRPELMADVWQEIADSLQRRDSVAIAARGGAKPAPPADTMRGELSPQATPPPPPPEVAPSPQAGAMGGPPRPVPHQAPPSTGRPRADQAVPERR